MSEKVITETVFTFLWMCGGIIPARIAWNRGRGIAFWWFLGLFFWPLLLFVAAIVPENKAALAARAQEPDPEREWRQASRWGIGILALMAVNYAITR